MSAALLHRALRSRTRHLSAFFVLGDPSPQVSLDVMLAAVEAGATMLELGLPYNAPCADGPAIQAASRRALAAGTTTDVALELVAILRDAHPELPLNLLVYANLVHARGPREFCRDFARAGASSLLLPDVLLEEGEELRALCVDRGLASVQLVGPRTPKPRLAAIDAACTGFLYLAALQGVTGSDPDGAGESQAALQRMRELCANPICLGFGLRSVDDLARAFANGARIAVVGSELARTIAEAVAAGRDPRDAVAARCRALAVALTAS